METRANDPKYEQYHPLEPRPARPDNDPGIFPESVERGCYMMEEWWILSCDFVTMYAVCFDFAEMDYARATIFFYLVSRGFTNHQDSAHKVPSLRLSLPRDRHPQNNQSAMKCVNIHTGMDCVKVSNAYAV